MKNTSRSQERMIPLRDTGTADFAALRAALHDAGFTLAGVLERTGAATAAEARNRQDERLERGLTHALDVLIRLLLDERAVAGDDAVRTLGDSVLALLERMGIVLRETGGAGRVLPTVMLYPVGNVVLASDLTRDPSDPESPYDPPGDAVYPAITPNTDDFLSMLPVSPCGRFLELCGGSGVAALIAAPRADLAVTVDITARSTDFASWNAKLNDRTNLVALQGDLYDPVAGQQFDRIVAHPPYMPALEQAYIYRDGGPDGEEVTRRAIAGLPAHLARGGRFHATCFLTDRDGEPVEQRVRAMLGTAEDEFDVVVVTTALSPVAEYYFRQAIERNIPLEAGEQLAERLQRSGAESIVLCSLLVARHTAPGAPVTLRTQRGSRTRAEHLEQALSDARGLRSVPEDAEFRPKLSPDARLAMSYEPAEGDWRASRCVITIEAPFLRRLEAAAEIAAFLGQCDGRRTLPVLFAELRDVGYVPSEMTAEDFATTVHGLARDGFIVHAG